MSTLTKPIDKQPFMGSARKKAAEYKKLRPVVGDLADFARVIDRVGNGYLKAVPGAATMPYNAPYAVLRRWVYRLGHAYAEANMQAELKAYVEYRHGTGRRLRYDDSFKLVIKLIRYDEAFKGVSDAEWSKMGSVLALAESFDIADRYLEHFIAMCGGMARIRSLLSSTDEAPNWVSGITRYAQDAAMDALSKRAD